MHFRLTVTDASSLWSKAAIVVSSSRQRVAGSVSGLLKLGVIVEIEFRSLLALRMNESVCKCS